MSAVNGNYAGTFSLKNEYGSNSRFVGTFGSIANSSKANLVMANSGIFSCLTTDKLIANSGLFSTIIADKVIANSGLFSYMSSNKVVLSNLLSTNSLATNSDGLIIAGSGGGGGGFTGANTIFVASNGSDTKGDGTSTNPYQTVAKCITELDGKTTSTNYAINFLSDVTETTTYSLLPNLIINGNNYRWIDATIVNDYTKWPNTTATSILELNNLAFVNLNYTSDFSLYSGSGNDAYTLINGCTSYETIGTMNMTLTGKTSGDKNMFYFSQNCSFYSTLTINLNCFFIINSSILYNTTFFINGNNNSIYMNNINTFSNGITINNFAINSNYYLSSIDFFTLETNGSGNIFFVSNIQSITLTMNDTNSIYYTDSYFNINSTVLSWGSSVTLYSPTIGNFITGLKFNSISGTIVSVTGGKCLIESTDDLKSSIWNYTFSNTNVDLSTNGVNGLDTGTVSSNKWYYIYAIGKIGNGIGTSFFIASASPPVSGGVKVGPVLPFGYLCWRYLGSVKTKTASTDLINVKQINQGEQKIYQWLELDGQNCINDAGGGGSTYDMTPGASILSTEVSINTSFTSTVASNTATIKTQLSDTIEIKIASAVAFVTTYSYIKISPDVNNQIFLTNNTSGDVFMGTVVSYTENLI